MRSRDAGNGTGKSDVPMAKVRTNWSCAFALAFGLLSANAVAQQALLVADPDTSAVAFRNQTDRVVTFICPSTIKSIGAVWGSDVYWHESVVCTAAVHAGLLAIGTSGQVTFKMAAGENALEGSTRNGVTSEPYQNPDATYSFVSNSETAQIDWHTTLSRLPDDFSSPITLLCPANGNLDYATVIGTDVYRADSAICAAGVHAGIITLAGGGRLTVTPRPKQETLLASTRNGVSSQQWSAWDYQAFPQPYSVSPAAVAVTAPTSLAATRGEPTGARTTVERPGVGAATGTTTASTQQPGTSSMVTERRPAGEPTVLSNGPAPAGLTVTGTPTTATVQ